MTDATRDSLIDLERHRLRFEENVSKLRASLKHWQTWEAEYEGLKEEILGFKGELNQERVDAISCEYDGELVDDKEIKQLFSNERGTLRTGEEVVNLLSRRIDYVHQNVETVTKQLDSSEQRLNKLLIISQPDVQTEEGLPLTEIHEELDEEGNEINSWTSVPGQQSQEMLQALEKAGIKNLEDLKAASRAGNANTIASLEDEPSKGIGGDGNRIQSNPSPTKSIAQVAEAASPDSVDRVKIPKSVRFAQELDIQEHVPTSKAQRNPSEADMQSNVHAVVPDGQNMTSEPPVIPIGESSEDAALRKEMLDYSLSDIGTVVAEMDLDDDSDYAYDDDDEGYDYDQDTSSVEEEDSWGRSTRQVVDDDYRRQMEELEKKLNAQMMENVGPRPGETGLDLPADNLGRIVVKQDEEVQPALKSRQGEGSKKTVKFAETLDIAPESTSKTAQAKDDQKSPAVATISDAVIERADSSTTTSQPSTRKPSRFKNSRGVSSQGNGQISHVDSQVTNGPFKPGIMERRSPSTGPQLPLFAAAGSKQRPFATAVPSQTKSEPRTVPEGPEGKILSESIIEKTVTPDVDALSPDTETLDPALLHQEVAVRYHQLRNRMIQREGGFLPTEEEQARIPLSEEEGGPKKVSRFKAAKLARSSQTSI